MPILPAAGDWVLLAVAAPHDAFQGRAMIVLPDYLVEIPDIPPPLSPLSPD